MALSIGDMSGSYCDALATEATASLTWYTESWLLVTFKELKKNSQNQYKNIFQRSLKRVVRAV
jgi:hypothetical protein